MSPAELNERPRSGSTEFEADDRFWVKCTRHQADLDMHEKGRNFPLHQTVIRATVRYITLGTLGTLAVIGQNNINSLAAKWNTGTPPALSTNTCIIANQLLSVGRIVKSIRRGSNPALSTNLPA
ncbi:hypothetical protein [Sphingomonas gilva]|uniref:hypothetical protein n=1 Tax=Sphingomonas gilva TaxID=2305907 RepID=UPI0011C446CA|nr:hypothetical protein [Sphingomonas gilva]